MRTNRRKAAILLLIGGLMLITGCWDRNEIEETGIVLGIGIDIAKGESDEKKPKLQMLHQFAMPNQFSVNASDKVQKDYVNMTSVGPIVFDNIRELSTMSSRPPNYEHLRIIVISEEAARKINLQNLINFFLRNTETRRTIRVAIARGKASDIFQKQKNAKNPSFELRELTDNYRKSLRMPPGLTIGNMSERLTGETSFVMQSVTKLSQETKLSGGAIIKGSTARLVGMLNELEAVGLNWLLGDNHSNGIVEGEEPQSGALLGYEVRSMSSSIKPVVNGERISFQVEIRTTGKLREDWAFPGDAFDSGFIERAEEATAAMIKQLAEKALDKTQHQFKVDVAGFGKRLSIKHPALWKRVKENWDERFAGIPVSISVKVDIQEFGTRGTKRG